MGLIRGLINTAIDIVELPIEAIKDIPEFGTDGHTIKKVKEIEDDIDNILDDAI